MNFVRHVNITDVSHCASVCDMATIRLDMNFSFLFYTFFSYQFAFSSSSVSCNFLINSTFSLKHFPISSVFKHYWRVGFNHKSEQFITDCADPCSSKIVNCFSSVLYCHFIELQSKKNNTPSAWAEQFPSKAKESSEWLIKSLSFITYIVTAYMLAVALVELICNSSYI